MQFRGEALGNILRSQVEPVLLCDQAGVPFGKHAASRCAETLHLERSVGIGNRRRIRYVQEEGVGGPGWRGGSHTTRPMRADSSCRVYVEGQRMGQAREHIPV